VEKGELKPDPKHPIDLRLNETLAANFAPM
jgi:hypothetical protein